MTVIPLPSRLGQIRRRIIESYDRTIRGGQEWVDGSLALAAGLREARDAIPANTAFSDWLKENGLTFINPQDRAALLSIADYPEVARVILSETKSRSYQLIWQQNKDRFSSPRITVTRPRTRPPGRAMLIRTMKLGETTMKKIKGTSLDNVEEMDELIMLNRGAPEGQQTPIVKKLVAAAVAGQQVSAIAEGVRMGGRRSGTTDVMAAWQKRMAAPWQLADQNRRIEFLFHLFMELDDEHQHTLIERSFDYIDKKGRKP